MWRQRWLAGCAILAGWQWPAFCDDPRPAPVSVAAAQTAASGVLRGMLAERQRFKSGVASISGRLVVHTPGEAPLETPLHGLYAFDEVGNKLRYDLMERRLIRHAPPSVSKASRAGLPQLPAPEDFLCRLYYTRNEDYSASWLQTGPSVRSNLEIRAPNAGLGGRIERSFHMFDARAASLCSAHTVELRTPIEQVIGELLQRDIQSLKTEADSTTLTLTDGLARSTLTVETRDGFRPVDFITEFENSGVQLRILTRWVRRSSIDVPSQLRVVRSNSETGESQDCTLNLDWSKINTRVPATDFDYHSFQNIPADLQVQVFDSRGPTTRNLGRWIADGIIEKEATDP